MRNEKSNTFILCFAIAFIVLAFIEIFVDFAGKLMLAISFCSCCISFGELLNNISDFQNYLRNFLYLIGVVGFFIFVGNYLGNDFLGIGSAFEQWTNLFTLLAFASLFLSFRKTDTAFRWRSRL